MSDPAFDLAPVSAAPEAQIEPDGPELLFSLFATFRVSSSHPVVLDGRDVPGIVRELEDVARELDDEGVVLRGWYDVSGVRSDADLLVWLQGIAPEDLQWSLRQLRRTALLAPLIRTWGALGIVIDDAESVVEASTDSVVDTAPRQWLSVTTAAAYPGAVRAVTGDVAVQVAAAHGVGDADWIVTHEADELAWIVNHLRDAGDGSARLGVLAGRLVDPAEIVEVLQ